MARNSTREQAAAILREILSGEAPEIEVAALLAVFATRGEQAPELAGFVDVMREQCIPVPLTAKSAPNWWIAWEREAAAR